MFAAYHMSDPHRKAAVKVLVPVPGEQLADRRDRIGRFHREALALRRLVHENIVQLYDFARERDGSLYLAMERLDGPTLSTLLKQGGVPTVERAVELMLPVLSAVAAAHKVGVIHRDMKPDNIVLANVGAEPTRRQEIKVVDFGVARLAGDTFTRTGQALGTPVYMPPEQANGSDIDERVDIYGAGAVFYELVTGRPPFVAPDAPNANLAVLAMVMTSEPRSPREIRREISPALESVIMRSMRRNRDERFSSVAVFASAIRDAMKNPSVVSWTPPAASAASPRPVLTPLLSLGADSLPVAGPGNLLQQAQVLPLVKHSSSTPVSGFQTGWLGHAAVPSAATAGVKVLVAMLYLILVAIIAVSLLLDRFSWRRDFFGTKEQSPKAQGRGESSAEQAALSSSERAAMVLCPAEMVQIPEGCFTIGAADRTAEEDEKPAHEVCLTRSYCVDRTEVDNEAYGRCAMAGHCRPPKQDFQRLRRADFAGMHQPVVLVSWNDAGSYCAFQRKRLPTEAEWEHAARGEHNALYPWGNEEPTCDSAVIGAYDLGCADSVQWCQAAGKCIGRNPSHPMEVGSRLQDRSSFGLLDMAGNVSEWVADWYDESYYRMSPRENPQGPADGRERVYRGGSWGQMGSYVRATFRNHMDPASNGDIGLGFRCAK